MFLSAKNPIQYPDMTDDISVRFASCIILGEVGCIGLYVVGAHAEAAIAGQHDGLDEGRLQSVTGIFCIGCYEFLATAKDFQQWSSNNLLPYHINYTTISCSTMTEEVDAEEKRKRQFERSFAGPSVGKAGMQERDLALKSRPGSRPNRLVDHE
jgi:hypothetical protein